MSTEVLAASRWICALESGAVFDPADVLDAVPALSRPQADTLLTALEDAHLIRRHGDVPARRAPERERAIQLT